jgi:prepilin-type N-terminal cleavage/methylation domain-containing protein
MLKPNINQSKQGFTLIELLVVIAIIGILAAIGVSSFGQSQTKARDARRKANITSLNTAVNFWYTMNSDRYPGGADGWTTGLVSSMLNAASKSTKGGFGLPKTPNGAGTQYDYWYTSGNVSGNGSGKTDLMGIFTHLEQKNVWYVVNSRGFSGEVTPDSGAGSRTPDPNGSEPDTTVACFLDDQGGGYQPCMTIPKFAI